MTMPPSLRRFTLTVHVISSVGLLGSIAAFLALAMAGLESQDAHIVRAAYLTMDLIARFVIVPLTFAALIVGLVQSLGTAWGLFRHYWIVAKLLLTIFAAAILLMKLRLIGYAAQLAAQAVLPRSDIHAAGRELALHAAGGVLVLLLPAILSVYKPLGLTPYGLREQQSRSKDARAVFQRPSQASASETDGRVSPGDGSITFTLRRVEVFGFVFAVLIAHIVVFHFIGGGHFHH